MKHILFVCVENSCRSQMAEAFGKIHGNNKVAVYSSGSKPSGVVNPKAIESMKEIHYDLGTHTSKPLNELPEIVFDFAITWGVETSALRFQRQCGRIGSYLTPNIALL